jgi:hypothetical protein
MPCHFHRAHSAYNRLAVKWVLLKNNYLILACYRVLAAKGSFLPYTCVQPDASAAAGTSLISFLSLPHNSLICFKYYSQLTRCIILALRMLDAIAEELT